MNEKYDVTFNGQINTNRDINQIKQEIQSALNLSNDRLEKLFAGHPVTIKKNIPYDKAQSLKLFFKDFGLTLAIVPTQSQADSSNNFTLEKPQPTLQEASQSLEHFIASLEAKEEDKYIEEIDDQQMEASIPATFSLSTDGRFGGLNLLNAQLYLILALLPLMIIHLMLQAKSPTNVFATISFIILVGVYAVCTFRMLILRLHDLDKSNWYLTIFLLIRIPYLGILIILLFIIYLVTAQGNPQMNQFGPPSEKGAKTGAIVLTIAIPILLGISLYLNY